MDVILTGKSYPSDPFSPGLLVSPTVSAGGGSYRNHSVENNGIIFTLLMEEEEDLPDLTGKGHRETGDPQLDGTNKIPE